MRPLNPPLYSMLIYLTFLFRIDRSTISRDSDIVGRVAILVAAVSSEMGLRSALRRGSGHAVVRQKSHFLLSHRSTYLLVNG